MVTSLTSRYNVQNSTSWLHSVFILLLFTAIEFSLGGSSPYTSNKTRINKHKRNNTKKQHKQNTVNTSTHITKTPTQLSKHLHVKKPTHTHANILQNKSCMDLRINGYYFRIRH